MIKSLILKNYKGFSETTIDIYNITCIIGMNGTGKSTIISAIQEMLNQPEDSLHSIHSKIGINDKNTTLLSLKFDNGGHITKTTYGTEKDNINIKELPKCISIINPIGSSYSFPYDPSDPNKEIYNIPIKDQDFQNNEAWKNILSTCEFTLKTAAEETTSPAAAMRFKEIYTQELSEKFTKSFNNLFESSINRKYKFEVVFEKANGSLRVILNHSYEGKNSIDNKRSSPVDLSYESQGFNALIALCSYIFNDQEESKKIFVVDEPFTNIHPKAQRQVSRVLESLSQRFQIIYTTHSLHLRCRHDNILCTFAEAAGDLSVCQYEDYDFSYFDNLSQEDLNILDSIERGDSNIHLIVDGYTDKIIYEKLFELNKISKINIEYIGGNGNIKAFTQGLKYSRDDIQILLALDPNERIDDMDIVSENIKNSEHICLFELPFIKDNHVKSGVENWIPNHIIEKASQEDNEMVEQIDIGIYRVKKKADLANYFVERAGLKDYEHFSAILDKINEMRKKPEIS